MCVQVVLQPATLTSTQHGDGHSRCVGELETSGSNVLAMNTVSEVDL